MTIMSIFGLNIVNGASEELDKIQSLQDRQVLEVIDAAIVTQEGVRNNPKSKQLISIKNARAK